MKTKLSVMRNQILETKLPNVVYPYNKSLIRIDKSEMNNEK